MQERNLIKW